MIIKKAQHDNDNRYRNESGATVALQRRFEIIKFIAVINSVLYM